jgi:hypothetical protein
MTRQKAIEAKCKECIYDPLDDGTWRQQVEGCDLVDCSLWEYRPKSRSKMPDMTHSVPVQLHYEGNHRGGKGDCKGSTMTCTEWLRWCAFFGIFDQSQMRALLIFTSMLETVGDWEEFVGIT